MSRVITRHEVAQKLRDWSEGRISAPEIQRWAETLHLSDRYEFEDWEDENGEHDEESVTSESVISEVLRELGELDLNLVLPEDVPIFLEFLETPLGQFSSSYEVFGPKLRGIDYASRAKRLRDVAPYADHLPPLPRFDAAVILAYGVAALALLAIGGLLYFMVFIWI